MVFLQLLQLLHFGQVDKFCGKMGGWCGHHRVPLPAVGCACSCADAGHSIRWGHFMRRSAALDVYVRPPYNMSATKSSSSAVTNGTPSRSLSDTPATPVNTPGPMTRSAKRMFDTVKRFQLNGPDVTGSSADVTSDVLLSSSSSSDNSPPPSKRPAWLTTPRPSHVSGDTTPITKNGEYSHPAEILRIMKLRCPSADCPRWHFSPHRVLGLQIHHKQYALTARQVFLFLPRTLPLNPSRVTLHSAVALILRRWSRRTRL
jgi:hypothetical protein